MYEQNNTYAVASTDAVAVSFMSKVYIWMTFGLLLTAFTSMAPSPVKRCLT
jgi:FtsH-binding integral membrane protein